MHQLRRGSCDVTRGLTGLLPLALFHLCISLQRCYDLVTHPVVVKSHCKVSLDLDTLHLAHKTDPLDKTSPLQAQESEDGGISLLLTFLLELLGNILQIEEPSTLDHQSLDLL